MTIKRRRFTQKLLPALLATSMCAGSALAFEQIKFDDGSELDISLEVGYVNAKRLSGIAPGLVKMPLKVSITPQSISGMVNQVSSQLVGQITDNQQRANSDDGDRSVGKHGTISNKINALVDINLKKDNYRAFTRISTFKDYVYDHPNHNESQLTFNQGTLTNDKYTFNGAGPVNEYSQAAKDSNGRNRSGLRPRLLGFDVLDAYVQGQWKLSDGSSGTSNPLTVKVGRQVVAWGEGLIFQGIGGSMNPQDAVKAQIPGTPLKEIFLPTEQIYTSLGVTENLTAMAYYKWKFRDNELPPSGTYFSPADIVGPGASFMSGGDMLGVYCASVGQNGDFSHPNSYCPATGNVGAWRDADVGRKNSGQWGLGLRYKYSEATELGAYYLKYTSLVGLPEFSYAPAIVTPGFPYYVSGTGKVDLMSTDVPNYESAMIQNLLPYSYHIKYMNDIKLVGASFTTKLGEYNVAGEIALRDGEPIMMGSGMDRHYNLARGKVQNMQVSALKTWGSGFMDGMLGVSQVALAGEFALSHLSSYEQPAYSGFPNGTLMVPQFACDDGCQFHYGRGNALYDKINSLTFKNHPEPHVAGLRTSMAYAFDLMMDYTAVFPGWDLQYEAIWMHQLKGNSAMQNGWNSGLQGRNDRRLSLGMKFTYQSNLELGLKLVYYLGNADVDFVNMRTMVDRDFMALTATYHF